MLTIQLDITSKIKKSPIFDVNKRTNHSPSNFFKKIYDEMGNIVHYYSHGGKFEFHQPNE
ncbi:hypothetical protein ABE79_05570 [Proteus mirabilis]|nr:hypothetical protein ABE79_05570 [Proteus mirabilis]